MATNYFYMHTAKQQSRTHLLCSVTHMPLMYGRPTNQRNAAKNNGHPYVASFPAL